MTVGTRHRLSVLDRAFRYQKAASKSSYEAHIGDLHQEINRLRWSDPRSPTDRRGSIAIVPAIKTMMSNARPKARFRQA
jgi:hypothetical protein